MQKVIHACTKSYVHGVIQAENHVSKEPCMRRVVCAKIHRCSHPDEDRVLCCKESYVRRLISAKYANTEPSLHSQTLS